jgi:hypothetical protein
MKETPVVNPTNPTSLFSMVQKNSTFYITVFVLLLFGIGLYYLYNELKKVKLDLVKLREMKTEFSHYDKEISNLKKILVGVFGVTAANKEEKQQEQSSSESQDPPEPPPPILDEQEEEEEEIEEVKTIIKKNKK